MTSETKQEKVHPEVGRSRLMGSNIYFNETGAVLDVTLFKKDLKDMPKIIKLWDAELQRVMLVLNWSNYKTGMRTYSKGFKFAISAPPDLLFSATYVLKHMGVYL